MLYIKEEEALFADDKELEEDEVVETEELEEIEEFEDEEEEEIELVETETGIYPVALNDIELECIYLGLLFNNPKAISKFYFEFENCHFSNDELLNLYKIILFRDGDLYATSQIKDGFKLPKETTKSYDLKIQSKKLAVQEDYSLELVYKELRKLYPKWLMSKFNQRVYLVPEIEVSEMCVEQGFIGSNMEQLGEEKEPVGWN